MRPLFYSSKWNATNEYIFISCMREFLEDGFYVHAAHKHHDDPTLQSAVLLPLDSLIRNDFSWLDWNTIIPLDSAVLDAMRPYEYEAMKICARKAQMNHDSIWEQSTNFLNQVRFWRHILVTHKINCFFLPSVPHEGPDYFIYSLCKAMGIPTHIRWKMPMLKDGQLYWFNANSIDTQMDEAASLYKKLKAAGRRVTDDELNPCVSRYLNAYTSEISSTPIGPKNFSAFAHLKIRMKLISQRFKRNTLQQLYDKVVITLKQDRKIKAGKKYYEEHKFSPDPAVKERYVLFALQVQPEASTLPLGAWFVEQQLVIQMLSYYLPKDVLLYVKEHPRYNYYRIESFYKTLTALPNVRLIDKNANTMALVRKAQAVATVTGNIGWESLFNQVPVIMFGEHFYKHAPGVLSVRTNEDCAEAMRRIFRSGYAVPPEDLKLFLYCIQDYVLEDSWIFKNEQGVYELQPACREWVLGVE